MRYVLLYGLVLALIGCGKSGDVKTLSGVEQANATPIDGLSRYALAEPITYGNVTLVPVVYNTKESDQGQVKSDEYISLEEAKKLAEVEISEMPQGQEVNRLYVKNLSRKPLMLLAGQLLLGGKQDRVVAKDTIVPPGEEMAVPVFCVEHGRWTGETSKFEFSNSMVPQSVRKTVITDGDQEAVWSDVAGFNARTKANPDTGTVRGGLYDKEVQSRIDGDLKKFVDALSQRKNVVGVVYLVNGEIGSFEIFGNPGMMEASREPLLKGFLADAAVQPAFGGKSANMDEVAKFIKNSLTAGRSQTSLGRGNANWSVSNAEIGGGESTLPAASMPAKDAAPDEKMLLHGSYSPNKK